MPARLYPYKILVVRLSLSVISSVLAALLMLAVSADLQAGHIVGGEVSYACLGWLNGDETTNVRTYEVRINVYRDTIGQGAYFDGVNGGTPGLSPTGNQSAPGHVSIYRGTTLFRDSLTIFLGPVTDVPVNLGNPCLTFLGRVGQDKTVYVFNVNLPVSTEPYTIAYQRCCRNGAIVNLRRAEEIGTTYFTTITPEAQQTCNASPRFNIDPPISVCAGQPFQIDFGATDREGDSLSYDLCFSVVGGGTDGGVPRRTPNNPFDDVVPLIESPPPYAVAPFRVGYDVNNQFGFSSELSIDSLGLLSGRPANQGTFALAVCIEEWRRDTATGITYLISETKREFQLSVGLCGESVTADLLETSLDEQGRFYIKQCGPGPNTIINESTLDTFIETYTWILEGNGQTVTADTKDLTANFNDVGVYTGTMILNRNSFAENCRDTAEVIIEVFPGIEPDFEYEDAGCENEPVVFQNRSEAEGDNNIVGYQWDFMDGSDSSTVVNPSHLFRTGGVFPVRLTAFDNNECSADTTFDVPYLPAPRTIFISPEPAISCAPYERFFENLSAPVNEDYDFDWRFGDGNRSDDLSPTHIYNSPGVYTVSLSIVSPIGCRADTVFNNLIEVRESPEADFTFTPEEPTQLVPDIMVSDVSRESFRQLYEIFNSNGDLLFSTPRSDFSYTLRDSGTVDIVQYAFNVSGCVDTIVKQVNLRYQNLYFIPNAFTPNGDGLNDIFLPKGQFNGVTNYQLRIWTRYGENIFLTEDINTGWDGTYNGAESPGGGYLYDVQFVDIGGEPQRLKGSVVLVR